MISNLKKLLLIIFLFSLLGCNEDETTNKIALSQKLNSTSLYTFFKESNNIKFLKTLEQTPLLIKPISALLENKKLLITLFNIPEVQKIIHDKKQNQSFFENFSYISKKELGKKELKEIEKDKNYLNYVLLASMHVTHKHEARKLYKKLKKSISIELISSFTLVLSSINENYKLTYLIDNFKLLQYQLSTEAIKELSEYPEYFAYFLYPSKKELNVEDISNSKFYQIQQNIGQKVIFLYKEIFKKYRYQVNINQVEYALLTIENIYPYLLEQYDTNIDEFEALFSILIEKDYILSLFQESKYSQTTIQERFAVFGSNNINNMISFMDKQSTFSSNLLNKLDSSTNSLMAFFYVANAHKNISSKEWIIFKELTSTLPLSIEENLFFIQKIEQSGYFRNIVHQYDFDDFIENSEHSNENPKYKYILLTPYPSQRDMTLYEKVLTTNISKKQLQQNLVSLISKNKEELEKHEFIMIEKVFGNLNRLDTAITVTSIALVPFTGGISLGAIATKMATKAVGIHGFKKEILRKIITKVDVKKLIKTNNIINLKTIEKIKKINNINLFKIKGTYSETLQKIKEINTIVKEKNEAILRAEEKIYSIYNDKNITLKKFFEEK